MHLLNIAKLVRTLGVACLISASHLVWTHAASAQEHYFQLTGTLRLVTGDNACPTEEIGSWVTSFPPYTSDFILSDGGSLCQGGAASMSVRGTLNTDGLVHVNINVFSTRVCNDNQCPPILQSTLHFEDDFTLAEFPLSVNVGPDGLGIWDVEAHATIETWVE